MPTGQMRQRVRTNTHVDTGRPAVLYELEVHRGVEKHLRDDDVRARIDLRLQVRQLRTAHADKHTIGLGRRAVRIVDKIDTERGLSVRG